MAVLSSELPLWLVGAYSRMACTVFSTLCPVQCGCAVPVRGIAEPSVSVTLACWTPGAIVTIHGKHGILVMVMRSRLDGCRTVLEVSRQWKNRSNIVLVQLGIPGLIPGGSISQIRGLKAPD